MASDKIIDSDSYLVVTTDQTIPANGDPDMEGYLVASAGVGTAGVVPASSATARIYGPIKEVAKVGSYCRVVRGSAGVAKVRAGGNIAKDDRITTDANGRGITTVTGGNFFIGWAREAAVAGQLFEVDLEFGMVR